MAVILEGHIRVPYEELETIKNKLNERIENTLNALFVFAHFKSINS